MKSFIRKSVVMAAIAAFAVGMLSGCGGEKSAKTQKAKYQVGIVQLVEHPALDLANQGIIDGLASAGFTDNITIDQQNAQADQSNLNTIAQRFLSNKVDLIAAIATPAAQTVANVTKDIPIVGTAITDYEAAKLVKSNEKPSSNVTGTTDMSPIPQQIDLVQKILPNAKVLGVVYSSNEVNSQIQVEKIKAYAQSKGLVVREATVSNINDIQQAVQNLLKDKVDAIFIPTDNVVASAVPTLTKLANEAKVPVFPADGHLVKEGCLATYSIDYYKLGFQTGLMAAAILKGEKTPADMPIEKQTDVKLIINEDVALMLGITIPAELLK